MGVPRLVSLLFLATGLYLLGQDVAGLITHARPTPQSLGAVWMRLDPGSLSGAQDFVERHLLTGVWDPGVETLLRLPAWTLPLAIGFAIMLADVFSQRRSGKG